MTKNQLLENYKKALQQRLDGEISAEEFSLIEGQYLNEIRVHEESQFLTGEAYHPNRDTATLLVG